jgi:hypothetical protein
MTKSKNVNRPKARWTRERIEQLSSLYPDNTAEVVGEIMGLSKSQVYNKAFALGLEKSEAFQQSDKSGRVAKGRQDPGMATTQFKPGHRTWNAGHKGWQAGGRSTETQFKKGRKPEESRNYVPIGSHRTSKDGYLERKVSDDPGVYPARRWVAVHRLVWEAANGPIPTGHIVVFKPGTATTNPEQITLDKLDCITRGENMRRNSFRTRNPELAGLYQLKGAINRQLNRIKREANEQPTHQ